MTSQRQGRARPVQSHWIVGLDIGGTFTDVMIVERRSGHAVRFKTLTPPTHPSIGALEGLRGVLGEAAIRPGDVGAVLHATTLCSNSAKLVRGARATTSPR